MLFIFSAQLTFNRGVSSPAQCQSCEQTIAFRYVYPAETVVSISWIVGGVYLGYTYMDGSKLQMITLEGYEGRLSWQESDPASLTLRGLTANDTGQYWCYVLFQSGNFIADSTYLNTSSPLGQLLKQFALI